MRVHPTHENVTEQPVMSQLTYFTQPDVEPSYFIEFLEFLDNDANIRKFRARRNERLNLIRGN